MTEFRKIFKDLLSVSVVFLPLYSFVWVLVLSLTGEARHELMVLLAPFVFMYILRLFAKKGYVFLLLSFSLGVASWFFLRYLNADGFVLFFLIVSLIYSTYAWYNSEFEPGYPSAVAFLALHVFLFFMAGGAEDPAGVYRTWIAFSYLLLVSFTVVYKQMDGLDYKLYLQKNLDGHSLSTKRLVRTNNTMGLAFAGLVLVVGFLSVFFPLHLIGRLFAWLASLLALLASRFLIPITVDIEEALGHIFMPMQVADWDAEQPEEYGSAFAYILTAVFEFVALAIGIIIIFSILYAIARKVKTRKKFQKFTETQEEVKLAGSLFDDLLDLLPRFKKFRHPIRRAYEKKVNSHIKQGTIVNDHDTTDIIADKIRDAEDIDELTAKYENVRYGREA